ncbi:hypothetical protein M0R72_10855 [Candidatus Pacearchaeota archaeon]|jgi:hypothetical protein|nr:hypothetical protein [Candidatus Pacearchaeota archaeon]
MPSNYLQIAQEIGRYLSLVEGAGRVHLFKRPIRELARLKELMFDSTQDRICGWIISREAPIKEDELTNEDNLRISTFVMRGYYSFLDEKETELAFQQLIDDVFDAFRPSDDLNGTCEKTYPVQAREISHIEIGTVVCHYCELTLDVQELIHN